MSIEEVAAREIAQLMEDLRDKDAEIDRLKGESSIKESAIRDLCSICRGKNDLITELSNTLKVHSLHVAGSPIEALIQRARESVGLTGYER